MIVGWGSEGAVPAVSGWLAAWSCDPVGSAVSPWGCVGWLSHRLTASPQNSLQRGCKSISRFSSCWLDCLWSLHKDPCICMFRPLGKKKESGRRFLHHRSTARRPLQANATFRGYVTAVLRCSSWSPKAAYSPQLQTAEIQSTVSLLTMLDGPGKKKNIWWWLNTVLSPATSDNL